MPFLPRLRRLPAAFLLLGLAAGAASAAEGLHLDCTAFGGSHTIRMSFLFHPDGCRLHWREIGRDLEVVVCAPPRLVARKPYAQDRESLLHFHLRSGAFIDQYGTVEDVGRCAVAPADGRE